MKRKRINQTQLNLLEAAYVDDPMPSRRTKEKLAAQLGLPIKRIQIWFQNRRAKQKKGKKPGVPEGSSPPQDDKNGQQSPSSGTGAVGM
jgi:hypothetical protein